MSPIIPHKPVNLLRSLAALALGALVLAPAARADVDEVLKQIQRQGRAQVIVRMKTDDQRAPWAALRSAAEQRAMVTAATPGVEQALRRVRANVGSRFRTLPYVGASLDRAQVLELLAQPEVESIHMVQIERKFQTAPSPTERAALASSVPSIDVLDAWAKGYDGTGYAVAVIDTGINVNHPMLLGKNVGDACFGTDFATIQKNQCSSGITPQIGAGAASNCPVGSTRCDHGTHVASTAVGNDGANYGVARGAKLVPIDVFSKDTDVGDCSPDPAPCELTDSLAVLRALDYVNDRAADLNIAAVNISVGGASREGYCDDDPRKAVIDMLRRKGIAVIVAAGNEGLTGKVDSPACISSAIAVGATNDGTAVASFSNFSTVTDLMAPGVGIRAASGDGNSFYSANGTSMAAPHVAGAWAVLRSALPNQTADALEAALKQTGVQTTRTDSGISVPKIQVYHAILRLQGRDRQSFNNVVASGQSSVAGIAYLRFQNDSSQVGTVKVTLRDVDTGAALGTWTSSNIPPHASLQVAIDTIENQARVAVLSTRAYFNADVESTFQGYMQHVLLLRTAGVLSNMTTCGTGLSKNGSVMLNVDSSALPDYPSRLRLVNTGAIADRANLTFYNITSGSKVGQWTSPVIPPGSAFEVAVARIENEVPEIRTATVAGEAQYNVVMDNLTGYVQHVVQSTRTGTVIDMTAKCALGPRAE